jgi:deoxyribodipyrimidine photolyase-like uncharacterized protein
MKSAFLDHGYTLVDWIENENQQMLSNVFNQAHTEAQTQNLYRSMARIFISLARVPQPRIGSWTIDNDGRLTLSNRPLFCHLQRLGATPLLVLECFADSQGLVQSFSRPTTALV